MTLLASDWLGLALLLCIFAWFGGRWLALALPFCVVITFFALMVITGSPRFTAPPPGDYQVLGFDIEVNTAIYALLKPAGCVAVYYRLPWSTAQANALQQAKDTAGEGGSVKAKVGGEGGGVEFEGEDPVTGEEPKAPESPAISLP